MTLRRVRNPLDAFVNGFRQDITVVEQTVEQINTTIIETLYDNAVIVKQASDMAGDLDSSKLYIIDGVVDMGTQTIAVPEGGLNIMGLGFGVSKLTSTENNYTMFVDPLTFPGDLFLTDLDINVSGTNSKVFDLDNQENFDAVECNTVNFVACTSLGTLSNYRQILKRNVAYIACQDGLEFVGPWAGGAAIVTTIAISLPANMTLFKAGAGLVFSGRVFSDMNALLVNDTTTVFDFAEANFANDGSFELSGFRGKLTSDPVPNISGSSTKARFRNCSGVRNTYIGGEWELTTEVTTDITAVDTPVKVAGTTTANELAWFTMSASNRMEWDTDLQAEVRAEFFGSFTGSNNNQVRVIIRKWDNNLAAFEDLKSSLITLNGGLLGTRAENVSMFALAVMKNKGDYLELWIENTTGANDVTLGLGATFSVSERPS